MTEDLSSIFAYAGVAAAYRPRPPYPAEQFHSTASLAREHMPPAETDEFGAAIRSPVAPWARDGVLSLPIVATVDWGRCVRHG